MRLWHQLSLTILFAGAAVPLLYAQDGRAAPVLERELARLAPLAGGTVGVGAIHLEGGREAYLNRDERFPMASSYKVPIAVQLLTRVDRGEIALDSLITLRAGDLHPGSGVLTELFDDPGVVLSVRNLLELMLLISDNSATDLVLRVAGGPQAVTERMRSLGIADLEVSRPTLHLIADWAGISALPPLGEWRPARFRELYDAVPEDARERAAAAFDKDLKDTASPHAMARLLAGIWRREVLSDSMTSLLLDIMQRTTTGQARLKGMLPADTRVAHKTGTIGGTTNDVGIVFLPHDAGHVVTVVFVKESTKEIPAREAAIAHLARAIHDYFLFQSAP